jgi:hypothetical protein
MLLIVMLHKKQLIFPALLGVRPFLFPPGREPLNAVEGTFDGTFNKVERFDEVERFEGYPSQKGPPRPNLGKGKLADYAWCTCIRRYNSQEARMSL